MTALDDSTPPPLRIGILGAARIARKTIAAIRHESSGCVVVAVASRSAAKADDLPIGDRVAFADRDRNEDVRVFSGVDAYGDLVSCDDLAIDAVYVPLPTTLKKEWTIRALRARKHVLVEKPVAPSAEDYREMAEEARRAGRYLMDGTMFVHHPRTERLLSRVSSGEDFGAATGVDAAFTILGHDDFMRNNIRVKRDADFQGCVGDLGWYCIRLAQLAFRRAGFGAAKSARATDWKLNGEGVPIEASCSVTFGADDASDAEDGGGGPDPALTFRCSYLHPWEQRGEVRGARRTAEVLGYVTPKEGTVSFRVTSTTSSARKDGEGVDVDVPCEVPQITLMWSKFREYCRIAEEGGWSDDARGLWEISWENQLVVDALMESVGGDGKIVNLLAKKSR